MEIKMKKYIISHFTIDEETMFEKFIIANNVLIKLAVNEILWLEE